MQGAYDEVLTKAFFDPVYARKLIDVAEASQKSSIRATARRMAGILGDNRGLVGLDIGSTNRNMPNEFKANGVQFKQGSNRLDWSYNDGTKWKPIRFEDVERLYSETNPTGKLSPSELESAYKEGLLTDKEYQDRKGDNLSPQELEAAYKEGLLTDQEYQDRQNP